MAFDFAAIPPDITSALMYSGAGAGPLMAAATAYNNLAAEMSTAATQWESIIATLTTEWTGAGSAAAAAAAAPIVSWLTTSAAALEQAGADATASAAAYEAAFMGVIAPHLIAINRTAQATAIATNVLGINTPTILMLDSQYAEYWVQDATTMSAYQAASAAAGALTPITPLTQSTNPGALGFNTAANANAATSPLTQQLSGLPGLSGASNALASAADPSPTLANWLSTPFIQNVIYNVGVTAAWHSAMITATFPLLGHFLAGAPLGVTIDDVTPLGAGLGMGTTLVGSTSSGVGGAAATAAVGEASAVGGLSVPASWSAAAPATLASSTAPLEGSGWTVAAEEAGPVAAMPGMPGMAAAAKGAGAYGSGPRYGFKPIVMPKQVIV